MWKRQEKCLVFEWFGLSQKQQATYPYYKAFGFQTSAGRHPILQNGQVFILQITVTCFQNYSNQIIHGITSLDFPITWTKNTLCPVLWFDSFYKLPINSLRAKVSQSLPGKKPIAGQGYLLLCFEFTLQASCKAFETLCLLSNNLMRDLSYC